MSGRTVVLSRGPISRTMHVSEVTVDNLAMIFKLHPATIYLVDSRDVIILREPDQSFFLPNEHPCAVEGTAVEPSFTPFNGSVLTNRPVSARMSVPRVVGRQQPTGEHYRASDGRCEAPKAPHHDITVIAAVHFKRANGTSAIRESDLFYVRIMRNDVCVDAVNRGLSEEAGQQLVVCNGKGFDIKDCPLTREPAYWGFDNKKAAEPKYLGMAVRRRSRGATSWGFEDAENDSPPRRRSMRGGMSTADRDDSGVVGVTGVSDRQDDVFRTDEDAAAVGDTGEDVSEWAEGAREAGYRTPLMPATRRLRTAREAFRLRLSDAAEVTGARSSSATSVAAPGRGVPIHKVADRNTYALPPDVLPTTEQAVQLYEANRGSLTRESVVGIDSLAHDLDLQRRRNESYTTYIAERFGGNANWNVITVDDNGSEAVYTVYLVRAFQEMVDLVDSVALEDTD